MQLYKDKTGTIFSCKDYCPDDRTLELINFNSDSFFYNIEHEDLVVSVPGALTLAELDHDLVEFGLVSTLSAPKHYSISRALAEDWGYNSKQVLGLELKHLDGMQSKTGGKVIKNVSGYDLAKIYIGSCNSLAVITGAHLRLEKAPTHQASLEIVIGEDYKEKYYNQELISFLHRITSVDFDSNCNVALSFTRGLAGQAKFQIKFAGSTVQLELRLKRALLRLEKFFQVKLSDVDIKPEECFYQSSDKRLSLSIKRSPYSKAYVDETKRLEFHLALSDLFEFTAALIDLIKVSANYSVAEDYQLTIYPKQSRIDLVLKADLEKWSEDWRRLKVRYILADHFINIYPITYKHKVLTHKLNYRENNFEQKIIEDLKQSYDPHSKLNPGILTPELTSINQ